MSSSGNAGGTGQLFHISGVLALASFKTLLQWLHCPALQATPQVDSARDHMGCITTKGVLSSQVIASLRYVILFFPLGSSGNVKSP